MDQCGNSLVEGVNASVEVTGGGEGAQLVLEDGLVCPTQGVLRVRALGQDVALPVRSPTASMG